MPLDRRLQMKLRDSIVRTVELVMGQRWSGGICRGLTKVGLRGLGVNVHHDLDRSGERFFIHHFLRAFPDSLCFDVGANVGAYSEALIRSGAKGLVAFEPIPATYELLRSRISIDPSAQPVNMAVGETVGTIAFDVPYSLQHSTLASRDMGITVIASSAFGRTQVRITTLDAFVQESGKYPDFVKIDVEGFEVEVFLGMKNLLSARPPKAIQFEFNQHHLKRRQSLADFSELLKDFRLFRLATRSMRPLEPSHYLSNIFTYSNVVAVHRSCAVSLARVLC